MKSKFITLFFCLFFGAYAAHSQTSISNNIPKSFFRISSSDTVKSNKITLSPYMLVSPSFYSNHLAFFCRQEIKLEKITKIPFKFRLGSVQQVDYLEGKNGSSIFR